MPAVNIELCVNLELCIQSDQDATTLYCKGEIIAGETSSLFRSAVVELLHQHPNVRVDLSGVHCMDRSGLETLVSLYSSARTSRSRVKFVNLMVAVSDSHQRRSHLQKLAS